MLHTIIMAGGSGTRFWPASRAVHPKQLLAVGGAEPLIVETIRRLEGLVPHERVSVITNRRQLPGLAAALPFLGPQQLVAEPEPRDTAPCVALAALLVLHQDPEGVMVVLPADHVIAPQERFQETLSAAAEIALEREALVTFGIQPRFPATGYGYIHCGEPVAEAGGHAFHAVNGFKEKPDQDTARAWLDRGGYLWNSGMFVWKAAVILEEIRRHAPELGEVMDRLATHLGTPEWETALEREFPKAPRNSIDREIMERSDRTLTVAADFAWDDLGSWQALPDHHEKDERGNVALVREPGDHLDKDSQDLVVYSADRHLIATLGLEGLTIVHTPDATLVCPTERAQEVKELVDELKRRGREDLL